MVSCRRRDSSRSSGRDFADLTGREVRVISFAHSGARLDRVDDGNSVLHEINGMPQGDLDSQRPTTEEQESCASNDFADAEVVLLDGCINDVGATNIALPFPFNLTSKKQIAKDAEACGPHIQNLVQQATVRFPTATIVVINYYRVVSKKSKPLFKAEIEGVENEPHGTLVEDTNELSREQQELLSESGETVKGFISYRKGATRTKGQVAFFQRWSDNSDAFLATSQDCFGMATTNADGTPGPKCKRQYPPPDHFPTPPAPAPTTSSSRVYLATVPDKLEYAYGASETHLWRLPSESNPDHMYEVRKALCKIVFKDLPSQQKCSINAIAHPNVKGAQAYRDSLVSIFKVAWGPSGMAANNSTVTDGGPPDAREDRR